MEIDRTIRCDTSKVCQGDEKSKEKALYLIQIRHEMKQAAEIGRLLIGFG